MPSAADNHWRTGRAQELDEIEQAHSAVGGTGRGRRYATQQINRAYAVLLASHFQGFCRDLHSESVAYLIGAVGLSTLVSPLVQAEFLRGRQLDRGNAQPGSIGADFGRFGINFWDEVNSRSPQSAARRAQLDELNNWRNAVAHQNFDPSALGGTTTLRLNQVQRWRGACDGLARSFDDVMRGRLHLLTGASPW